MALDPNSLQGLSGNNLRHAQRLQEEERARIARGEAEDAQQELELDRTDDDAEDAAEGAQGEAEGNDEEE